MVWLYSKWQEFMHPKQPHPSMEFYDRAWLKEADDADRREVIVYLVACFVVFALAGIVGVFVRCYSRL